MAVLYPFLKVTGTSWYTHPDPREQRSKEVLGCTNAWRFEYENFTQDYPPWSRRSSHEPANQRVSRAFSFNDVTSTSGIPGHKSRLFESIKPLCGLPLIVQVLLVPHEPTMEWKRLVLKFATNDRVTYLKGDLRNTTDLTRASAHTASSCFILTNR